MRKQFKSLPGLKAVAKIMKSSAMSAYVVGVYMLNDGGLDV